MGVQPIVLYPDPILKKVCRPADWRDPLVQQVAQDLVDTMQAGPGVGVAAPQIGHDLRIFVVDVTPKHPGHGLLVLLNPEMVGKEGAVTGREGCLSIPDFTASVRRYSKILLQAVDPQGNPRILESDGFEAVCLQHELDHLDGVLFLDRVSCLKTDVFRRKGVQPRFDPQEYPQGAPQ